MDKVTILVIDDLDGVRDLYARMLLPLGCNVLTAETPMEGLEKMSFVPTPSFIFLDLNYPTCSADKTLSMIPEFHRLNPQALIIVMTGMTMDDKAEKMQTIIEGSAAFRAKQDISTQEDVWHAIEEAIENGKKRGIDPLEVTTKVLGKIQELRAMRASLVNENPQTA